MKITDVSQVAKFTTEITEKMVGQQYHAIIKNKSMPYTHIGIVKYNDGWEMLEHKITGNFQISPVWIKLYEHLEVVAVIELEDLVYKDYEVLPTLFNFLKN